MTAQLHILRSDPPLNDVVGQLRLLAAAIERGEEPQDSAYLLLPVSGEFPRLFGFGNVNGEFHPLVQFELAKAFLINNVTERYRG